MRINGGWSPGENPFHLNDRDRGRREIVSSRPSHTNGIRLSFGRVRLRNGRELPYAEVTEVVVGAPAIRCADFDERHFLTGFIDTRGYDRSFRVRA